jgi:single-strand DNA-binding protein
MASVNRVIIAGNLTRDPEVTYLPSGTPLADLGLAINDNYKNRDGQLVERTCFVNVAVWGKQGELCREYLSKGSPVLIEGRLRYEEWESKQGEKRNRLSVTAERVQFLGSPRRGEGGGRGGQDGPPPREPETPADSGAGAADDDDDLPF